jgi:hypothetical protein
MIGPGLQGNGSLHGDATQVWFARLFQADRQTEAAWLMGVPAPLVAVGTRSPCGERKTIPKNGARLTYF